MTNLPHIPAIRRGRNYESLDKAHVIDHRTGKELASISQVNAGCGEARDAQSTSSLLSRSRSSSRTMRNGPTAIGF